MRTQEHHSPLLNTSDPEQTRFENAYLPILKYRAYIRRLYRAIDRRHCSSVIHRTQELAGALKRLQPPERCFASRRAAVAPLAPRRCRRQAPRYWRRDVEQAAHLWRRAARYAKLGHTVVYDPADLDVWATERKVRSTSEPVRAACNAQRPEISRGIGKVSRPKPRRFKRSGLCLIHRLRLRSTKGSNFEAAYPHR